MHGHSMHVCGAAVAYTMLKLPSYAHEVGVLGTVAALTIDPRKLLRQHIPLC
jgi:hypothetical protein